MLEVCGMNVTKNVSLSCRERQSVVRRLQQTACKTVLAIIGGTVGISLVVVPLPTCENVGR